MCVCVCVRVCVYVCVCVCVCVCEREREGGGGNSDSILVEEGTAETLFLKNSLKFSKYWGGGGTCPNPPSCSAVPVPKSVRPMVILDAVTSKVFIK